LLKKVKKKNFEVLLPSKFFQIGAWDLKNKEKSKIKRNIGQCFLKKEKEVL
jgi:hypothetical protein